MARELHPHLQHMVQPQNLTLQQQQQLMRRRQPPTTQRPIMNANMGFNNSNMDKERPMLQVKIENTTDFPIDNTFTMNSRQSQMQLRQQQMTAMSALQAQAQAGNQFRSLASLQVPQMQMQQTQ